MDFSTYDRLKGLQRAVDKTKAPENLMPVLRRGATAFGLRHLTLMNMPTSDATLLSPLIHMTTLPQAFIEAFDAAGLLRSSPVAASIKYAKQTQWTIQDLIAPDHAELNRFATRMRRMGMSMGVIYTAPPTDGKCLGLLFFGDRSPLRPNEEAELGVFADRVFSRFDGLKKAPRTASTSLSARELEVIRWTAEGKTSNEIGGILGLSDHTINAYLANAIRKLDCVNRTQLVAKAIRMRLID